MPLDPVVLEAPLFAGATATERRFAGGPAYSFPGTTDIKTAARVVQAPASQSTVMAWYRQAFARCGFTSNEYGSGSSKLASSSFRDFQDPSLQNGSVEMVYQAQGQHSTLVLYYAYAITLPPRPASSLVPDNIGSLEITYYPKRLSNPVQAPGKPIRITLTRRVLIESLASAVNSLGTWESGPMSCPADTTPPDRLRFVLGPKRSFWVTIGICGYAGIKSNGTGLWDASGSLEGETGYEVYRWLYFHPPHRS